MAVSMKVAAGAAVAFSLVFLAHSTLDGEAGLFAPTAVDASPPERELQAKGSVDSPDAAAILARESVDAASNQTSGRTEAYASAPFRGTLVDAELGRPLPHYAIDVRTWATEPERLWTDAEGRFESARSYPEGELELTFLDHPEVKRFDNVWTSTAGAPEQRSIDWVPGGGELRLEVATGPSVHLDLVAPSAVDLEGAYGQLRGTYLDDDGSEIGVLRRELDWTPLRTEGGTWLRFPPRAARDFESLDRWRVALAIRDGQWQGSAEIDARQAASADTLSRQLVLEAAAVWHVDVVLESAEAPAGVDLLLDEGVGRQGRSTLRPPEAATRVFGWLEGGVHSLRVSAIGFETVDLEEHLVPGARTTSTVHLLPLGYEAHLRGVVRSRSGSFQGLVAVNFEHLETGELFTLPLEETRWVERGGELVIPFDFEGLAPGEYEFTPKAVDQRNIRWSGDGPIVVAPAASLELVCEDQEPFARLGFRVLDARTGEVLERAFVQLVAEDGGPTDHLFAKRGSPARSEEMPVGHGVRWCVSPEGYVPVWGDLGDMELGLDGFDVELRMRPGWGTRLIVTDDGAEPLPLPGAEVWIDGVLHGRTDSAGAVELTADRDPELIEVRAAGWTALREVPTHRHGDELRLAHHLRMRRDRD